MFSTLFSYVSGLMSRLYYLVLDILSFALNFVRGILIDTLHYVMCDNLFLFPIALFSIVANNFFLAKEVIFSKNRDRINRWISNPNYWQKVVFKSYIQEQQKIVSSVVSPFEGNSSISDSRSPLSTFNLDLFLSQTHGTI